MGSSIDRFKGFSGKWTSEGLGVVTSFMYVAADRPGGGEGRRGEHSTEIIPLCIYHPFIKKSHFGIFYPAFTCVSEV